MKVFELRNLFVYICRTLFIYYLPFHFSCFKSLLEFLHVVMNTVWFIVIYSSLDSFMYM